MCDKEVKLCEVCEEHPVMAGDTLCHKCDHMLGDLEGEI